MKIILMNDGTRNLTFKKFELSPLKRPIGILCHNYTNSVKRLTLEGNNEKYYVASAIALTAAIGGAVARQSYKNLDKYL